MKKAFLTITVISAVFTLAACAKKDSEYAAKMRQKNAGAQVGQTATNHKDGVPKNEKKIATNLCEKPKETVCAVQEAPIAETIRKEGREKALTQLKKEFPQLSAEFKGTSEEFQAGKLYKEELRFLHLSDAAYRMIYDYDKDIQETKALVQKLYAEHIQASTLSDEEKKRQISVINSTDVMSISQIIETTYPGKNAMTILATSNCEGDGLGLRAHSSLLPGASAGVILICPGQFLKLAGKDKDDRITSLVMLLAHEMYHQLQFQARVDVQDAEASKCLRNSMPEHDNKYFETREREAMADMTAGRILMAHLKAVTDLKTKQDRISLAMNWLCHIPDAHEGDSATHFTNEERIKNLLKIKEAAILTCGEGPRC
ncbi:hypothetical protein AZI85_06165 [Bdellovibrio bacteriovorus]|uniref:DUF2268 domain-containing protein n=1 Tax=Bdellovibrio bacteriovorus TaxID=959 RepID=A0A150WFR0_BDEBC|nr:hypothetical protein [Bdellovibrio bacteriovorus]KYG61804.1 hypothetical protein AZI85_06165 [Bdellovibrio bacteriovorus]